MSKELEALNNLTQLAFYYAETNDCLENAKKYHEVIETSLKEKEQQDEYIKTLESENLDLNIDNTRMSKALEIIKEKEVIISILIRSNTLDEYNHNPLFITKLLTQEEFGLLKKVLL